jgi:hypothetical protein
VNDFWKEELTDEQTDELLHKAADEIRRRRMETVAILTLEMHKPIAGFLAQSSVVMSPFLIPFLGFSNVNDFSRLLSKRDNVERLLRLIEAPRSVAKEA